MIPIIPYVPPSQRGQKPNLLALIASIILLLFLMFGLIGFTFMNGMSINLVFVVLGIIVLIASFIPIIVVIGSRNSNTHSDYVTTHRPNPPKLSHSTWTEHSKSKFEYCTNCGSLVDFSDFFCTNCGVRLK